VEVPRNLEPRRGTTKHPGEVGARGSALRAASCHEVSGYRKQHPDYKPDQALTRLLSKTQHRGKEGFDHFWKNDFDALRAASTLRPEVTVRVVLDADHSPALSAILRQLNPQIAAGIINPRKDGTAVALEIGAGLNQGALVTMLADRGRPGNATARVDFLGRPAEFPTAPWQIAAAAHVPVVLCAGLYRGGNRYDLHFELVTEQLQIDRKERQVQLRGVIQDFANRLADQLRVAPYNWFNFYDFWNDRPPGVDQPDARSNSTARG
jgi:predicted LPLAT superfamily acyltransferase